MKRTALLAFIGLPLCSASAGAQGTYLRPAELPAHLQTNSSMERGWRLLDERRCTAVTDGCNQATRTWPHDPGRYIERGFLVADRQQGQPSWLLMAREAPAQNGGIVGTATDYRLSTTRAGDLLPRKVDWSVSLCGLSSEGAQ